MHVVYLVALLFSMPVVFAEQSIVNGSCRNRGSMNCVC